MGNSEFDLFDGTKFASKKKEDIKRSSYHIRAEKGFHDLKRIVDNKVGMDKINEHKRRVGMERRLGLK